MADPNFNSPGRIDVLLGVDVFGSALLRGRRFGPPGSPNDSETCFELVLVGTVNCDQPQSQLLSHHTSVMSGDDLLPRHTSVLSGDDLLRKFWETEELNTKRPVLSIEERSVVTHFQNNYRSSPLEVGCEASRRIKR